MGPRYNVKKVQKPGITVGEKLPNIYIGTSFDMWQVGGVRKQKKIGTVRWSCSNKQALADVAYSTCSLVCA